MSNSVICCAGCHYVGVSPNPDLCPECNRIIPPPITREQSLQAVKKILEDYEGRAKRHREAIKRELDLFDYKQKLTNEHRLFLHDQGKDYHWLIDKLCWTVSDVLVKVIGIEFDTDFNDVVAKIVVLEATLGYDIGQITVCLAKDLQVIEGKE